MTSAENFVEYCRSITREFESRLNRIRTYVPDHNLTSGTANETLLRDFLSGLAPGRYRVGQGFICDPTRPNCVSRQCDIIVYDQVDYPLVHAEGDVKVVWPDAVRMIVEVKTTLDKRSLYDAIRNIEAAKQVRRITRSSGLVFAFRSSLTPERITELLRQYPEPLEMSDAPEAILILDKKTVITTHKFRTPLGENDAYDVLRTKDGGALITYFFLFFLAITSPDILDATVLNTIGSLLTDETDSILQGLQIGQRQVNLESADRRDVDELVCESSNGDQD